MKISKNHHYISQFLIKNFTDKDGIINMYDKETDKIFQNNSRNVFYEKDRNTFTDINGIKSDTVEKMYADLEKEIAPVLSNVLETGKLNKEDLRMLLFLAYLTKWRIPQYDKSFNDAKNYFSVGDLGLGIKEGNMRLNIDLESAFETDMQQETKRFLLAIQPFRFKEDYQKIFKHSFLLPTPYPALLGDCPFNEFQVKSDEIFEDFVFPISKTLTLIYASRLDKEILKNYLECDNYDQFIKDFSITRDLATIHLADRFVGCSHKDHLEYMVNSYKETQKNKKVKDLMAHGVFQVLYTIKFNK